jgi:hypothetical protein
MSTATEPRTYGYRTKRALPAAPGNAKVCTRCDLWFLAAPRERTCFGCLPRGKRTLRATQGATTGNAVAGKKAKVNGHLKSTFLGLDFKPGTPLSKVLAIEAAAWLDANAKIRSMYPPWDGRSVTLHKAER